MKVAEVEIENHLSLLGVFAHNLSQLHPQMATCYTKRNTFLVLIDMQLLQVDSFIGKRV